MSYRSRVQHAAQEVLRVEVKDLHGPNTKIVTMPYETYLSLKKEMEMEIVDIAQAGKPEAYVARLKQYANKKERTLPSTWPEFAKKKSAKKIRSENENAGGIPEPPVQNKQRLPGETKGQYHGRRMKEGKAYKKWEEEYGAAYSAKHGSIADEPEEPKEPKEPEESVDLVKQAIEEASMTQLQKDHPE